MAGDPHGGGMGSPGGSAGPAGGGHHPGGPTGAPAGPGTVGGPGGGGGPGNRPIIAPPAPPPEPPTPPLSYALQYVNPQTAPQAPEVKTSIIADQYARMLNVPFFQGANLDGPDSSIFSRAREQQQQMAGIRAPTYYSNFVDPLDRPFEPLQDAGQLFSIQDLLAYRGPEVSTKDVQSGVLSDLDRNYTVANYLMDPSSAGLTDYYGQTARLNDGGRVGYSNGTDQFGVQDYTALDARQDVPSTFRIGDALESWENLGPRSLAGIGSFKKKLAKLLADSARKLKTAGYLQSFKQKYNTLDKDEEDIEDKTITDFAQHFVEQQKAKVPETFAEKNMSIVPWENAANGGRVGRMGGGMMIIEDNTVENNGIGAILKKYKQIRSEL